MTKWVMVAHNFKKEIPMNKQIEIITAFRNQLIKMLDELSNEQINKIPTGFNNNLVWHLGHVIASQQAMGYKRSENAILIDEELFQKYKGGTKPEGIVDQAGYERLKELSAKTLAQFDTDYDAGLFNNYTTFAIGVGVEITSINDALGMLQLHEGMHFGYAQALKRAIGA
jgi:hypothetical protein